MSAKYEPLKIKDCDLLAIATGQRAQNLKELRNNLLTCHPGCIYNHFWGVLVRPGFTDPEFNNDFAQWASHSIHDKKLAETLGILDPTDFMDIEDLRGEVIEIIEQRLDESEYLTWAHSDRQFNFVRAEIVVFDTNHTIKKPQHLPRVVSNLSVNSIFYHFIDARRRSAEGGDDIRAWLLTIDGEYKDLCNKLSQLDPYFVTLTELRNHITQIFKKYFKKKN
ncbi:MAG: hypothetical protein GWO07_10720 [Candidatus Dadabacteria bacterium]|nr:hypothetical protein [Candidatus Dadabacteria bacterium]NIV41832.1 hypothetical protein [Candidatus Dadabacteria bacterium]NIX15763.1 hypothetical protein [Candidatus Dadabacteria bacterium]